MGLANRVVAPGPGPGRRRGPGPPTGRAAPDLPALGPHERARAVGADRGGGRRRRGPPRARRRQQRGDARRSAAVCGRCRPSWRCARLTTPRTGSGRRTAPRSPPSTSTARWPTGAACSPSWSACAARGPSLRAVVRLSPALVRAAITGGTAADEVKEKLFTRLLGGLAVDGGRPSLGRLRPPPPAAPSARRRPAAARVAPTAGALHGHRLGVARVLRQPGRRGAGRRRRRRHPPGRRRRRAAHRRLRGEELPRARRSTPAWSATCDRAACCRTTEASSRCCGPTATAAVICACSTRRTTVWTPGAWARSGACAGSPGSPRWPAVADRPRQPGVAAMPTAWPA